MRIHLPVVRGTIDRRMLINFRAAPEPLQRLVPPPFRVKRVHGWGMAGICLIRLADLRPKSFPLQWGIHSENAAHRIAVEWEEDGALREGVFIPRRDTSSRMQTWIGGRIFPGIHHHAGFHTEENESGLRLEMRSGDGQTVVTVEARVASELPRTSIFESLSEASAFFERGALGYSVTHETGVFDGLELRSFAWKVMPLEVARVHSSFFSDTARFPEGTVVFDSALLMRGIEHEWHGRGKLNSPGHYLL